jgi:hypothetical protein
MYNPSYPPPDSSTMRTSSALGHFSGGRERKNKRKKRAERDFSDTSTQDGFPTAGSPTYASKEKKKGSKCAVM